MYKILRNTIEMDDYSIQRLSSRVSQYLWYKLWGNTKQGLLPDGYTQVDYIESSGTQYIDTNFTPNSNTKYDINIEIASSVKQLRYFISAGSTYRNNIYCGVGGQASAGYGSVYMNTDVIFQGNTKYNLILNKNLFYIDGVLAHTFTKETFNNTGNAILFAKASDLATYSDIRLYDCKIYDNDILVRNFIPCYRNSDNEVGLYDLVNGVFYTNQGTGVFTYGSVAPTPDAPIEVKGVGDRTGNLLNATSPSEYARTMVTPLANGGVELSITNATWTVVRYANIPVKANSTYTITIYIDEYSGTGTFMIPCRQIDVDGTVIFTDTIGSTGTKTHTFTAEGSTVWLGVYLNNSGTAETATAKIRIMLNEGSSALPYERYGYKIPVVSNVLADYSLFPNSVITADGYWRKYDGVGKTCYIEAQPNTKYYLNININYQDILRVYSNPTNNLPQPQQDVVLTQIIRENNATSSKYTFTTPANCKQLVIQVSGSNFDSVISNMVMYSDIDTKIIYLNEPIHKNSDYVDILSYSDHNVARKIKKLVLTGTENFELAGSGSNTYFRIKIGDYNSGVQSVALCSHFEQKTIVASTTADGVDVRNTQSTNGLMLAIRYSQKKTVSDFKQWLVDEYANGTPVTIWYVLTTPETEEIHAPDISEEFTNIVVNTEVQPSQVDFTTKGKKVPQPSTRTVQSLNTANQLSYINNIKLMNEISKDEKGLETLDTEIQPIEKSNLLKNDVAIEKENIKESNDNLSEEK